MCSKSLLLYVKNLQDYLRLIALIVFIAPNKLKEQESKYTAGEVVTIRCSMTIFR